MSCSLLEALQFGVTVIDRSNSGNKELITHNFNGFIYESPSEFKAQLEVLINEP
jgi:glycosyltransferase involved in cell wall biosynthesis